jgi:hypothetical protein
VPDENAHESADENAAGNINEPGGQDRAVDGLLRELARAGEGSDERFVARVMSLAAAGKTLELASGETAPPARPAVAKRRFRRAAIGIAAAAAAAVVIASVALRRATPPDASPPPRATGDYRVADGGEIRRGAAVTAGAGGARLELGGYCRIEVDPRASLRIEGSERAEQVFLDRGRITCEVERSMGSFTVLTGVEESRIEVEGTRFVVEVTREVTGAGGGNRMPRKQLSVKVLVGSVLVVGAWGRSHAVAGEAVEVPRPGAEAVAADTPGSARTAPTGAAEGEQTEQKGPPLAARVLPRRTVALVVVENVGRTAGAFKETSLYGIWKEEEVRLFAEPILPKMRAILEQAETDWGLKLADLVSIVGGQVGLAFVGIDTAEGAGPLPEFALVAEVSDPEAALRLLDRGRSEIEKDEEIRSRTWDVGPLRFGRIKSARRDDGTPEGERADRMELGYVLTRGALYVGFGPDGRLLAEMLAAATGGPGETLAQDEEFLAAVERAGAKRDLFGYVNVKRLIDAGFRVAKHEKTPPEKLARARRTIEVLGLDGVESTLLADVVDPPGFRSQLFVHAPSPRKGLLGLIPKEPMRDDLLRSIPESAPGIFAFSFRADKAMALVRELAGLFPDVPAARALGAVDSRLAVLRQSVGMDIEAELLPCLGPEGMLLIPAREEPGIRPDLDPKRAVLVLSLRDPERFSGIYKSLFVFATGYAKTVAEEPEKLRPLLDRWTRARFRSRGGITAQMERRRQAVVNMALAYLKALKIMERQLPGGAVVKHLPRLHVPRLGWILPAVALSEGRLVMGLSPDAVAAACKLLAAPPEQQMVATAEYRKALARAGVEPGFAVTYQPPLRAEDVATGLAVATLVGPEVLRNAALRPDLPKDVAALIGSVDLTRLPSAQTLAKHGLPQITLGWTDKDGVGVTTYGGVGISVGAVAGGGIWGVAAYADELRRRGIEARQRCASRLTQVVQALKAYAEGHGGSFPAKLDDLVPNYVKDKATLLCPSSEKPYVYLSGLNSRDRPHLVVAYEAPGNHAKGANVAYVAGTVRWWQNAEWIPRMVDAQVRRLGRLGRSVKVIGPRSAPPERAAPAGRDEPEEFF